MTARLSTPDNVVIRTGVTKGKVREGSASVLVYNGLRIRCKSNYFNSFCAKLSDFSR